MYSLKVCFVCGSPEVVVAWPIPLCKWHEGPPATGIQNSNDIPDVADFTDEDYYDDIDSFGIPIYPI